MKEKINMRIDSEVNEGRAQEEIERLKKICWYQRSKILELQKELSKYKNFNQWENIEYFSDWSDRSEAMSKLINPSCRTLLDLGCGEGFIRKYIDPNITYYGCDYTKRDSDTIVCDLAVGEYPQINVDVVFIAGVLEYLSNWDQVLSESCKRAKQVVLSYSTTESAPDRNPIWVTNISESSIIDLMNKNGFELKARCMLPYKSVGFSFERE